jgi:aminopeptidase N
MIGLQAFKNGLHKYFHKYQWTNTELTDFVGSMNEAFIELGGNQALGHQFNLIEWCDTWLATSGVNILEPVVEWNDNGSIKTLSVK